MKYYFIFIISILLAGCQSTQNGIIGQIIKTQNKNSLMIPPTVQGVKVTSLDEAYKLQDEYNKEKAKSFGPISGYKIAYASKQSQKANGISEPVYGALFEKQFVEPNGSIKIDDFSGFHIESEIAFTIGKDVPKDVDTVNGLKPYLRSVHIGYDIPDNIFNVSEGKPVPADIIIFGAGAHSYSVGMGHYYKNIQFTGNNLVVWSGGKRVYLGNENNTMGSPLNSLLWLQKKLSSQGKTLKAGNVVLCGAVAGAHKAKGEAAKGTYTAKHPILGELKVRVE